MGGVLIGLAAATMLLGLGRIAGVSGMAARATGIADSGAPGISPLPLSSAYLSARSWSRAYSVRCRSVSRPLSFP